MAVLRYQVASQGTSQRPHPPRCPGREVAQEFRQTTENHQGTGDLHAETIHHDSGLISLCSGLALGAEKKVVLPKGAEPNAGWSYGILIDDTLYVSGMGGEDAAGKIPASFEAEVKQSLDNINAVLKEAGMTPADVVSVQVFITDGALFARMNAVYKTYFKDPKPTRTTVVVSKLVGAGHLEITATARK